ncbi:MAG: hypothetical protein FWF84_07825, partial [Kiritimatiellaeota bacterium]|nr:hypothetical protein [Kiritimatiellota bacterium]
MPAVGSRLSEVAHSVVIRHLVLRHFARPVAHCRATVARHAACHVAVVALRAAPPPVPCHFQWHSSGSLCGRGAPPLSAGRVFTQPPPRRRPPASRTRPPCVTGGGATPSRLPASSLVLALPAPLGFTSVPPVCGRWTGGFQCGVPHRLRLAHRPPPSPPAVQTRIASRAVLPRRSGLQSPPRHPSLPGGDDGTSPNPSTRRGFLVRRASCGCATHPRQHHRGYPTVSACATVTPHCFHGDTSNGTVTATAFAIPGTYQWGATAGITVSATGPTGTVTATQAGTVSCTFTPHDPSGLSPVNQPPAPPTGSAPVAYCDTPGAATACEEVTLTGQDIIPFEKARVYVADAIVRTNAPCCGCESHYSSYSGDLTNAPPLFYGGNTAGLAVTLDGQPVMNGARIGPNAGLSAKGVKPSEAVGDQSISVYARLADGTAETVTKYVTVVKVDIAWGDGGDGQTNAGLAEVSFLDNGGNLLPVSDDLTGQSFDAPHWRQGEDGEDRNHPVAYVRGTKPKASARLNVQPSGFSSGGVWVRASGNAASFLAKDATASGDGAICMPETEASAPLPNVVGHYEKEGKDGADQFYMTWEASLDGGATWEFAGSTYHTLYVPLAKPHGTALTQESLYYVGCRYAKGLSDINAVIKAIWADPFAKKTVECADGIPLTYYGTSFDPEFLPSDTAGLLRRGDGTCAAWARLFLDVLKIHGFREDVNLAPVTFDLQMMEFPDFGFMIKNWEFVGSGSNTS